LILGGGAMGETLQTRRVDELTALAEAGRVRRVLFSSGGLFLLLDCFLHFVFARFLHTTCRVEYTPLLAAFLAAFLAVCDWILMFGMEQRKRQHKGYVLFCMGSQGLLFAIMRSL
jgi:hypothetical protein